MTQRERLRHKEKSKTLRKRLEDFLFHGKKNPRIERYLGCTRGELIRHIESQFDEGMEWGNYNEAWFLDFIKPRCYFFLNEEEERAACFHWSNLRPYPMDRKYSRVREGRCQADLRMHRIITRRLLEAEEE